MGYTGPSTLHPQHAEIAAMLAAKRIEHLYHFTSISNLPGILRQGALLAPSRLQELGVWDVVDSGGNQLSHQLDIQRGNDRYVALSYRPKRPMVYGTEQEKHICYLVLNARVALGSGVVFTNTNATGTGVQRASGLAGLNLVDFFWATTYSAPGMPTAKAKKQAEVQAPLQVPLEAVEFIAFRSKASLEEGLRLCRNIKGPPFEVHPDFFVRQFGCLEARLSDTRPSDAADARAALLLPGLDKVSLLGTRNLTVIALLQAVPGLKVALEWWGPLGLADDYQHRFDVVQRAYVLYGLPSEHARKGMWTVRCSLQVQHKPIREFNIPFQIV